MLDEYFCPNCQAILNNQSGFDPDKGAWRCTECGTLLMDEDADNGILFEGVAWYCDECGALLNRQSGFSDTWGSWVCTECGHRNPISEDEILSDEDIILCPQCGKALNKQSGFSDGCYEWECTYCGAELCREYSSDSFEIASDDSPEKETTNHSSGYSSSSRNSFSYDGYSDYHTRKSHKNWFVKIIKWLFFLGGKLILIILKAIGYLLKMLLMYVKRIISCVIHYYTDRRDFGRISRREYARIRVQAFVRNHRYIQVGYHHTELWNRNVDFVHAFLYNRGFKNIGKIAIKDIDQTSKIHVGAVAQVLIDGASHYDKANVFSYNSRIVILYHDKKEILVPYRRKFWRKLTCFDAKDVLTELGFVNITGKPIFDLRKSLSGKDGTVSKIIIKNECRRNTYYFDECVIIEYHTLKEKL